MPAGSEHIPQSGGPSPKFPHKELDDQMIKWSRAHFALERKRFKWIIYKAPIRNTALEKMGCDFHHGNWIKIKNKKTSQELANAFS